MASRRYVKQNADGGWDVLREGDRRASIHAETKDKALARARTLVEREGGGEIRVVNTSGKVLDTASVRRKAARPA